MSLLSPIVKGGPQDPPILEGKKFNQELLLPIEVIRAHTKTDDVISVPDALINIYRNSALEAAEKYTGMLLREQRVINQPASNKRDLTRGDRWRPTFKLKLLFPTSDGVLYLYGGKHTPQVQMLRVQPGDDTVEVPINHYALDMTPCCAENAPCGKHPANFDRMLMYRAGLSDETDVPPCIIMGALKYIAWQIENPGGNASMDTGFASSVTQSSGNNAAWKSGAIEEWRLCTRDY